MTVQQIVDALLNRGTDNDATTKILFAIDGCDDTADDLANCLVLLVERLKDEHEEDAKYLQQDIESLSQQLDAAAREIEQAERFRQPDLIHEAYRVLTGTRLYV